MYTDYLLPREPCIHMFTGAEGGRSILLFNYVEVNQYTTLKYNQRYGEGESLYNGPAYAGVDKDSIVGNGDPNNENTYDDDFDAAPVFQLSLTKEGNRILRGNVFDDLAEERGAESIRSELKEYLGDGKNESKDKKVNEVRVELVEIKNGTEDLKNIDPSDPNKAGTTKAVLDSNEWAYDNIFGAEGSAPNLQGGQNAPEAVDGMPDVRLAVSVTGHGFTSGCKTKAEQQQHKTFVAQNGDYVLDGYIPGVYLVRFTWGGKSVIYDKKVKINGTEIDYDAKAWTEQYKNTVFRKSDSEETVGKERYDEYLRNPRWYLYNKQDYQNKSNALDVTSIRKEIDDSMNKVGYGTSEGDKAFTNIEAISTRNMLSKTAPFEIPLEDDTDPQPNDDLTDEGSDGFGKNGRDLEIEKLDFGVIERPKTKLTIDNRIERAKVILRNGSVLVDASVVKDGDNKTGDGLQDWKTEGPFSGGVYLDPSNNDVGTMKVEVDKEILKGSTLEINYLNIIKNESYLDYVVTNPGGVDNTSEAGNFGISMDGNEYYYWQTINPASQEVELSPLKIVDYLDNDMNYQKRPDDSGASEENDVWERIINGEDPSFFPKETYRAGEYDNRQTTRLVDWLFGRYTDKYPNDAAGNISTDDVTDLFKAAVEAQAYKQKYYDISLNVGSRLARINRLYWTILRDQTDGGNAEKSRAFFNNLTPSINFTKYSLKAKESKEIRFIASKRMDNTDTDDMEYNNSVELLQVGKTGGPLPEGEVYGNESQPEIEFLKLEDGDLDYDVDASGENPWTTDESLAAHIDPNREADESIASSFVFTPPTGDDSMYKKALTKIIVIASLCFTASVIALIRVKIIKAKELKKKGKKKKKSKSK